jgi:hypothetical protein
MVTKARRAEVNLNNIGHAEIELFECIVAAAIEANLCLITVDMYIRFRCTFPIDHGSGELFKYSITTL